MKLEEISKYISYVLRHNPSDIGVELGEFGFISTQALIDGVNKHYGKQVLDLETLRTIVETDNKKRYSFKDNETLIRANQGHSVNVDLGLVSKEPPEFLFHGTGEKSYSVISKNGIKKMSRDYVHLSKDIETALTVGKRHGVPVIFKVDSKRMYNDNFKFYQSENGVWLTDFVPVEYIEVINEY